MERILDDLKDEMRELGEEKKKKRKCEKQRPKDDEKGDE